MLKKLLKWLLILFLLFVIALLTFCTVFYYGASEGNVAVECEWNKKQQRYVVPKSYQVIDGEKVPLQENDPHRKCPDTREVNFEQ